MVSAAHGDTAGHTTSQMEILADSSFDTAWRALSAVNFAQYDYTGLTLNRSPLIRDAIPEKGSPAYQVPKPSSCFTGFRPCSKHCQGLVRVASGSCAPHHARLHTWNLHLQLLILAPHNNQQHILNPVSYSVQALTSDDPKTFQQAFLTYIANPFPAVSSATSMTGGGPTGGTAVRIRLHSVCT